MMKKMWQLSAYSHLKITSALLLLYHHCCCSHASYYLGCYIDAPEARDLSKHVSALHGHAGLTPSLCREACSTSGNYTYFGVQSGDQCHCGTTYGRYGQVDDDQCGLACLGDRRLTCGGQWRNAVYALRPVSCPGDAHQLWRPLGSHCYLYVRGPAHFASAESYCSARQGLLLSPNSEEEFLFVNNTLLGGLSSGYYWTGLYSKCPIADSPSGACIWEYTDRSSTEYSSRVMTSGNLHTNRSECVLLHESEWIPADCSERWAYVCEADVSSGSLIRSFSIETWRETDSENITKLTDGRYDLDSCAHLRYGAVVRIGLTEYVSHTLVVRIFLLDNTDLGVEMKVDDDEDTGFMGLFHKCSFWRTEQIFRDLDKPGGFMSWYQDWRCTCPDTRCNHVYIKTFTIYEACSSSGGSGSPDDGPYGDGQTPIHMCEVDIRWIDEAHLLDRGDRMQAIKP